MPRFIELKKVGSDTILINKHRIDTIRVINDGPVIEVDVNGTEYITSFNTINKMNEWISEARDD